MKRAKWIAVVAGALLTVALLGTALAEPPTPTTPATPPTPQTDNWDSMRDWMDSQYGEGFFDRMHGSYEGMTESCNTMMGSGAAGGGMMGGGMMGSGTWSGGMMGGGTWGGGMMGPAAGASAQGRYGGIMGQWAPATRSSGWGTMMSGFMNGLGSQMRSIFY